SAMGASGCGTGVSLAADATIGQVAGASCVLLAGRECGAGGMAHFGSIHAGVAIGSVARGGARVLSGKWSAVLVAGSASLAEGGDGSEVVDAVVFVFCDAAVRRAVGISSFFRPCHLSDLLRGTAAVRALGSGGPGVRGSGDVDLRDDRVPSAGGDPDGAAS